jgi:hypothetical protein
MGEAGGTVIAILIIISLYFLIRYLIRTFFVSDRESNILNESIRIFNGKLNYYGNPEFQFNNWNVIIEYDFETGTRGGYEYIIALIDISDIDKLIRKKLDFKFDIIEKDHKIYIKIYSSWGYQGIKFKERLNDKIGMLNSELNKYETERKQIY